MPASVPAFLLSGGGNDFLALVEPERVPEAATIRAWCTRGLSVGADGLFVLRREAGGAVRMDHFNADGGAAELCLNGSRCAAVLSRRLGWADRQVELQTAAGQVSATLVGEHRVRLSLDPPAAAPVEKHLDLEPGAAGETGITGWFVTVGVPQFVVARPESLADTPVAELGRRLRHHPAFGDAGTNVMFVRFASARLEMRSFERGVEAETLACGTGALAAAAVAVAHRGLSVPLEILTGGGTVLRVDGTVDDGRFEDWSLEGDARCLARLDLLAGSIDLPAAPRWSP